MGLLSFDKHDASSIGMPHPKPGLGYAVIQTYATFDMPRMYALLAVGVNVVLGRYTELPGTRRPSDAH